MTRDASRRLSFSLPRWVSVVLCTSGRCLLVPKRAPSQVRTVVVGLCTAQGKPLATARAQSAEMRVLTSGTCLTAVDGLEDMAMPMVDSAQGGEGGYEA